MNTKLHSKLKRTLAWIMAVSMMVQGVSVVSAEDFSSEPDVAVVSEETADIDSEADAPVVTDDESIQDADSDVTIEEETEDEQTADDAAASSDEAPLFSDGADEALFSDSAEAVGEEATIGRSKTGKVKIAGDQYYSYTYLWDKNDVSRYAVGFYPANGADVTLNVGDRKGMEVWTLYNKYSTEADLKRSGWVSEYAERNTYSYVKGVTWESSNEDVAIVVNSGNTKTNSGTTGVGIKAVGEGTATITATWEAGSNYASVVQKTITNSFTVKVEKAAEPVKIGQHFTVKGSATTPLQIAADREPELTYWGAPNSTVTYAPSGDGYENCDMSWTSWKEDGMITHYFSINYGEMVMDYPNETLTEKNYYGYNNTTYHSSVSTYGGSLKDQFYRPAMAENNIEVNVSSNSSEGKTDNNDIVFYFPTKGTNLYVGVNAVKAATETEEAKKLLAKELTWTVDDPTVIDPNIKTDNYYQLQLKALKVGSTTLTGEFDGFKRSFKVYVEGYYIDEPVGSDGKTKTIEMTLDEKTRKINTVAYDDVDGLGLVENPNVSWGVDNGSVLTVKDGVITAKSAGTATVTGTYSTKDWGSDSTDSVKVIVTTTGGSISLGDASTQVKVGGTKKITPTVTYNGETIKDATVTWSSSDESVATVDKSTGTITGVKKGTATITAECTYNGKTFSSTIDADVVYDGFFVSKDQTEVNLTQGGTQEIVWQVLDMGSFTAGKTGSGNAGYSGKTPVTWTSKDTDIATVDDHGVIAAGNKTGSTTVTAKYNSTTYTINVNVKAPFEVERGKTTDITGTAGITGSEHTWSIQYWKNGHVSLNAEHFTNADYVDLSGNGATATVTGKIPKADPVTVTHGFSVSLETEDKPCTSYEGVCIKVNGEEGLYFDEERVTLDAASQQKKLLILKAYGSNVLPSDSKTTVKDENGKDITVIIPAKPVDFTTDDEDGSIIRLEKVEKNTAAINVVAVGPGKATVTAKTGNYTATCEVTVTSAKQIFLEQKSLTVGQGATASFTAKAWDGSAYVENPTIKWTSLATSIATVDDKGTVTGVGIGTVAIKAEWEGATATAQVEVKETKDVKATVVWDDKENQDGVRPASVKLQLTANDKNSGEAVDLNADNEWTYTWAHQFVKDDDDNLITYDVVTAGDIEGYTATVDGSVEDGFTVTYKHDVRTVTVNTAITWDDANDRDGKRPDSVTVQLATVNGDSKEAVGDKITLDASNEWKTEWTELAEYKAGKKLEYTIDVDGIPSGENEYTTETTKTTDETGTVTSFAIKSTHVPLTVAVPVQVVWDDGDNQDGVRPASVEATLYADDAATEKKVTLNDSNNWTDDKTFSNLDKSKDGKDIVYSVKAADVEGYTLETTSDEKTGVVLKYTHKTEVTSVTASVKWDDADNQDGKRPESVNLQLKADEAASGDPVAVNAAGEWKTTWTVAKNKPVAKEIVYTVEAAAPEGYKASVSGTAAEGYVITLSHTPEVVTIPVSAQWNDTENQDGKRPASVEITLAANGKESKKVALTAENNWKASFDNLDVYAAGKAITYTVTAADVEGYTASAAGDNAGFVVSFNHETEKTSVSMTTVWDDKNNQDGYRPGSYTVQLKADGQAVGDIVTLNSDNGFANKWDGLQKNRTGKVGEKIEYTVEVVDLDRTYYEAIVKGDDVNGFVVTNLYVPLTKVIPASVQWNDADNQDGIRPASVDVELYADGQATGNKVTLTAENEWKAAFAETDMKKNGVRIAYTAVVTSGELAGYTCTVTGEALDDNGFVVNYAHTPEVTKVIASTVWDDADNQDGIRPNHVNIQLKADGVNVGKESVLDTDGNWSLTWDNLPKFNAGKEIIYTVEMTSTVDGYGEAVVTGNAAEGYTVTYAHSVAKTKVTVKNTWSDLNNVVDSRPSKLVVEIYANGKSTGKRVTLTSANKWTASVSNLDKNAAGKAISYTGKVVSVPSGYSISIKASNGTVTVTSKYTRYTKKLTVKPSKTVLVYNGKTQRPSVTVYNGNKKVSSKYYTVTYKNNKNTGYATVIVKGKSSYAKYAGKAAFIIRPKQMRKPSVKSTAKRTLAVTWTRDAQATKYVVQYSQSSKFTGKTTKSVTISKNTIRSTTLKGLTSGKYYYVRVRSYKVANGKNIYAPSWSQSVRIKVK